MILIGLGNKAQNGKDTAGEAIVNYYNLGRGAQVKHGLTPATPIVRIYKFAEALYKECRELHGMVGKDAPLLQRVGHARRQENPTYWINKMFDSIFEYTDIAVITDVRYKNEANEIKARGGFVINVQRLNADGTPFISLDRDPNHSSEIDLDGYNFDYYLKAKTGETALLGEQAITLIEYIRGLMKR